MKVNLGKGWTTKDIYLQDKTGKFRKYSRVFSPNGMRFNSTKTLLGYLRSVSQNYCILHNRSSYSLTLDLFKPVDDFILYNILKPMFCSKTSAYYTPRYPDDPCTFHQIAARRDAEYNCFYQDQQIQVFPLI